MRVDVKLLIIIATVITLGFFLPHMTWAMQPPSADDTARINRVLSLKGKLTAEQIIERAEIKKCLRRARELGNYRMDPYLAKKAIYKAARSYNASKGKASPQEWSTPATPPPAWKGMPTKGNVRVFALLIDFSDYAHTNDSEFVNSALFGEGDPSNFPRESLASYYDRASYGKLDMSQGTTFGWYRPQQLRSEVEGQYRV